MEEGYKQATIFAKIAFFLAILAFLLDMIGFYTPYWQSYQFMTNHLVWVTKFDGIWRFCTANMFKVWCRSYNYETTYSNYGTRSWFEATQAFETLGFIAALAALVLIVLYIFVPQTSGKRIIGILSMLACFAAAGCIMLGIIIYGSKVERNLSWSFALCCIAGIIFGVSGVLLLIDMLKK
ncbi:hypothetical protein ACJMK2_000242 [Sinanodonta woodiana]|uniref:Uncharacterized protein n=1 Tax=Sinanodonta woodiana TaxID=1069815 RepID=A0ABD3XQZ7_SINWO